MESDDASLLLFLLIRLPRGMTGGRVSKGDFYSRTHTGCDRRFCVAGNYFLPSICRLKLFNQLHIFRHFPVYCDFVVREISRNRTIF